MASPAKASEVPIVKTASENAPTPGFAAPPVEFLDLKAQFSAIREDVMAAVSRVMESQHFILGPEVKAFEEEAAAFLGARHAVGCASGSDALLLAMMALDIGPDDEVITTPFTFFATGGSIARLGARPVFVDAEAETFNIDPQQVEQAVTSRTRAIMPVHLFGLPAEMDAILSVARAKGLHVVEDAAQAIGARYGDRYVGTLGSFGCFSFFPSKNLGGAGDGGLVTTQDAELAERLRALRVHGSRKKYHHELLGMNSRLDALQAAILRVKLRHVQEWSAARNAHAERYRQLFDQPGLRERLISPPLPAAHLKHAYNQFVIRVQERDALREFLRLRGISTEVYYPLPLHLQPAFAGLGYKAGALPVAEAASCEVLALPVYPELTEAQQQRVVEAIAEFFAGRN